MKLTKDRKGELFIVSSAFLWGLFPVVTVLSINNISYLVSLGLSSLIAAIFFAVLITAKNKWGDLKDRSILKDLLLITLFIGILYFGLYYLGLKYTTPGNASIIALSEILFSFLLFHVWKRDYIPKVHVLGALLMILGALIVLFPGFSKFQIGDLIVLSACIFAPFGNYFQQKARKKTSGEVILFVRNLLSAIIILTFASFLKINFLHIDLKNTLVYLLINGIIILGISKIFWIEGIHRINVTKAVAIESLSPLVTLFFAWSLIGSKPTIWQLTSFVPMFFGIILLGINKKTVT